MTDENNRLLNALSSNSVDLDNSFGGEVRFWGVSFTGEISVAFGSDVTQAVLSTDCYDLSDNFVRVNKIELVPGEVSLINGLNSTAICFGDGVEDRLQFTNTANTGSTYGYVLTDQADNIISVSPIPEILIEEQDLPGARVYGFAYSGTINTAATGNVFSAILSTECSDLTDNFVDIEFIQLDGAQVSLSGGATEITICANDGVPDILSFETSSDADGEYAFVLTDANDNVLIVLSGNSFNFDNVNPGVCRIWGISYFGDIDINFGDNLLTAPIADDCFDLSDNAIEITKDEVIGGAISFTDGSSSAIVCPDGNPDVLSFITTGTSTANYGYLITDQNNVVLGISENNSFDFETVNAETIRTWGIAYSGDITIQIGETVSNNLASNCANLSSNFLVVNKQFPDGGMISTSDQLDNYNICLGDDNANLIELSNNSTFVGNYIYVLTNQEGEFIKVIEGNNIDLENEAAGIYRIYGLAFTGQFIAIDGTIIEEEALSDNCFDPSDNFISIISDAPSVGSILDGDKSNIAYVCPNDGQPNVIDLFPTDASFNPLVYIITDENDIILSISTSNSIDFDDNLPANTRVYGVSYSGTLNMNLGDDINNSMLSNECAVLSDNFYEVIIDQPEAGLLTTQNGEASSFRLCVNDGNSDVFTFETNSNSLAQYLLLITDENDVLIDTVHSFDIDFETDEPGINRVWGISYTGNFNLQIGQSIFAVALSDDCFEVTENFIELRKTQVDGGTINSAFDSNPIYVCPLDGVADSITFTNSGAAASDQYTYLLTNRNGLILDYLEDGTFDFDDTGFRELRVYGLSYTGSLNDNVARGINTSIHSDSCYALSNNFITVFMDIPDGGTISSADGATSVDFCASPRNATLSFAVDNNSQAGYAYIMVDDSSKVVAVSDSNSFDMSTIAIGSYQVYGISYTGLVIANVGDDIQSANLASSCFDLSTNTVIVNKLGDVDGGAIAFFDGSSELYSCPGDGSPDLAILTSNSSAQLENYVYVFTDENNNILVPNAGSTVIDFDRAAPIVYRIWAVSYTGDYTASTADDILEDELSSDCAEVSENFLTVFNTGATGGTVSTTDSLTELGVTALETISLMASDPIGSDYIYVLTDDLDRIIEASLDNTISTTDLITGDYRIYGLALNGNFTGLLGENINEAQLSDECFGLSDNFVSFRIDESQTPIVAEEEENITFEASTRLLEVEVRTWPNPASNEMTINLEVKTDMQSNMVLNIVNIYGQQMKSMQLDGKTQQFTVNIADLENGLYII
ncbi:MAG: T9SS type A sorting domain-containing protein, partial [Bacteroidota bacterium]